MNGINIIPKILVIMTLIPKNIYIIIQLMKKTKENIYFIDKYSHTYATEDRARIFENICSCNENSIIKIILIFIKKALYLEEEIYILSKFKKKQIYLAV